MSENPFGGATSDRAPTAHVAGLRVDDVRFRIGAGAGPVRRRRRDERAVERAVDVAEDRRRERRRLVLVVLQPLERLRAQLRREVDQIVRHLEVVARVGRRLGRERLRRRRLLARHVGLRHRPLFDRPHRLAGHAIEDVEPRLLARRRDRLDRLAVDVDVEQQRRRRSCRSSRSDGARTGSATCAGRSSDRRRPGSRRTGCCRGDGRRRNRTTASRPAGRRARAPRRR